jgi:thioredoxin-related protein
MVVFCLASVLAARAEDIQWRTDYATAVQEAREKSKPLLIDAVTDNCTYCKMLEEKTFRDPAVISYVNSRYVALKVHTGQDPNQIIETLKIDRFPTLVVAHPQGKVLQTQVGFVDVTPFLQLLQTHADSAAPPPPEWMERDLQIARQAIAAGEFSRALWFLKGIVQDGKDRPPQVKARQLLQDVEQQATARLARANQLIAKDQNGEALEAAADILMTFAGTQASLEAGRMLVALREKLDRPAMVVPPRNDPPPAPPPPVVVMPMPSPAEQRLQQRSEQARDFLAQAKEDFGKKQFHTCLSRCDVIVTYFPDLPEKKEAQKLAAEIKSNPELLGQACDSITDQLGLMFLTLADGWMKRGQPQQAVLCLERVIKTCPTGSRQAELAQIKLSQIQGQPTQPAEYQKRLTP